VVGNQDLFDVNGSAAASQPPAFSTAHRWDAAVLDAAAVAGDRKTPYSKVTKDPEAAEELLQACLLIARCKARAYARRLSAAHAAEVLTGWLTRDVELADASCVCHRVLSDIGAVPMLPDEFII
jgi:hypothetical protein